MKGKENRTGVKRDTERRDRQTDIQTDKPISESASERAKYTLQTYTPV